MALNYNNSPITDVHMLSVQGNMKKLLRSATFLVLLSGEVQVIMDERKIAMNKNDVLMIPPCAPFLLSGGGSNLLMALQIDYDFFSQVYSNQRSGHIVCDSTSDRERDYTFLRQILSYIALNYFENAESKDLRIYELCYSLLYLLSTNFFEKSDSANSDAVDLSSRGRHIMAYVESNYMNEIQLDDLSKAMYLSPSYLSRLFKKLTGKNFKAYLEDVRLSHASEEMRTSDKTITVIAYNNGFPNVSALSTAIRKKYGMSPSEYRTSLQNSKEQEPTELPFREIEFSSVATELKTMAGNEPVKTGGLFHHPVSTEYTIEDVNKYTTIPQIWMMINIGDARTLQDNSIMDQLAFVQNEIGFRYARIENVLDENTGPDSSGGQYNFAKLLRIINALRSHALTPFLDLSCFGEPTLTPRAQVLYRGDKPRDDNEDELYINKVESLVKSCINTFGANVVERWCLEICIPHDKNLRYLEDPKTYCRRFINVYRTIKELLPNIKIGGPEHHIAQKNSPLYEILDILKKEGVRPDFVSVCAIPYEPAQLESQDVSHIISPDPYYIKNSVKRIREEVHSRFDEKLPICVSALAADIRTRNYVNDSCFQSVFFAKNTVDLIGLAEMIGYWQLSDLCSEYYDTRSLMFGGTGIITKDGLKKTGFAALKRMARLNSLLIQKEEGMVLTTNGIDSYSMLLYNYSHFNTLYCLSNGENTTLDNVYSMFNNPSTKDIGIHVSGLKPGNYRLITTTINREHGSVFDQWLNYGTFEDIRPYDIQYLRDITHPHRAVHFFTSENGHIDYSVSLAPHEVKLLVLLSVM